jgi:hypothetical protein
MENMTVTSDYNSMNSNRINYITEYNDRIFVKDSMDLSIYIKQGDDFEVFKAKTDTEENRFSGRYQTATVGKYLYVISNKCKYSYKLNLETGAYSEFHALDEYYPEVSKAVPSLLAMQDTIVSADKFYILYGNKSVLEYDTTTDMLRDIPIKPRTAPEVQWRLDNEFLDRIVEGKEFADMNFMISGIANLDCAGQAIFDYCMGLYNKEIL